MGIKYQGFVLLIWFPGVLHAQSATESCRAPRLDGGFFAPKQAIYSHGTKLTYTCHDGRKPVVKGWWATSTCDNGKWSHQPQCIDENYCIPPTIPNAKYTEDINGWYKNGSTIRITCHNEYAPKGLSTVAKCTKGSWSSLPICEKSGWACSAPPKIPHAVIIHQEYQEVFASDSELYLECEDEYTTEGEDSDKSMVCIIGSWTEGPTCRHSPTSDRRPLTTATQSAAESCRAPRLDGGFFAPKQAIYSHGTKLTYTCHDGRKPVVKGWWATSTCDIGKWSHQPQCIDENDCFPPTIPNAKYTEDANGWYKNGGTIRITCDKGYASKDRMATARCISGSWSSLPICEKSHDACSAPPKIPHAVIIHQEYQEVFASGSELYLECEDEYTTEGEDSDKSTGCITGSWTKGPTCRYSPTSDRRPLTTAIHNCGPHPNVPNGDVVQREQMFLKYQCNAYYTQDGPDTVVCYNNGTWSQLPTCKETVCVVDPALHAEHSLKLPGVEYVKEGETKYLPCFWHDSRIRVACTNGNLIFDKCCFYSGKNSGFCY